MDQAKQRERDNQQVKEEKMVSSMILSSNGQLNTVCSLNLLG
jgi:hypothetical protein